MGWSTSITTNLAANTTTANLLSGDINEFVTVPSQINIFAVTSAAGVALTMLADSDVAIDDQEITGVGTSLDKSQHLLDSFLVQAGTRLALRLRETAGVSTADIITGVEVNPL